MEKRRKNRIILSHRYRDSRFRRKKTGSSRRILAGIGFYAFLSSLLNQPVRNIFTGMEYTGTAVVCLFLMLGTAEYPVNKSYHRFSINRKHIWVRPYEIPYCKPFYVYLSLMSVTKSPGSEKIKIQNNP